MNSRLLSTLHRALQVVPVELAQDRAHRTLYCRVEDDYMSICTAEDICARQCVMISPTMLGVNARVGKAHEIFANAVLHLGLLDKARPSYRPDIAEWFESLYPRDYRILESDAFEHFRLESSGESSDELFAKAETLFDAVCKKFQYNVFGTTNFGSSLFKSATFINHSCAPNCIQSQANAHTSQTHLVASILSLRPLRANEQVTISYLAFPIDNPAVRARQTGELSFECRCEACCGSIAPSQAYAECEAYPPTRHCWWCGEGAVQKCSLCGIARFCSRKCQVADWSLHRNVCSTLQKNASRVLSIEQLGACSEQDLVDFAL